jgi:hypothetical protein
MASSAHHAHWIRKEAAVAAFTFNAALQKEHARGCACAGSMPADEPAKVIAQFQPLDPGIVNEEIPAFFIGRNMEGFWVARDARGQIGGLFLLETSALSFAKRNSEPAGCATIFPSERFELDLENSGNPIVAPLGWLKRLAIGCGKQMTVFIDKMTEVVKRRSKDLHGL